MRRADVSRRRHRGNIGGDGDQESGGSGAISGRADEHGDGRFRVNDCVVDVARGVDQTAWRAERQDDQRRRRGIRLGNDPPHVLGGHRMDDSVDLGGINHGWRLALRTDDGRQHQQDDPGAERSKGRAHE